MPNEKSPPSSLDVDVAKKVLVEAGRQFCYLVKEENKALSLSPFFQGNLLYVITIKAKYKYYSIY